MIRVLSLGAGVQSSTLLMSCRGVLPKLDAAVFADTQWEPKAVYTWLEFLREEASRAGIPVHVVTAGNLRDDALMFLQQRVLADGKRHASMPIFVRNLAGSRGLIRRQCTGSYKIDMIERCIRRDILGMQPGQRDPDNAVEQWIGISSDEIQWAALTPDEFEDACQFDEEMRLRDAASAERKGMLVGTPYLHSSLIPLRQVRLGTTRGGPHGMAEECQGMCGV